MASPVELIKSNHKKTFKEIILRTLWYVLWKLTASWTPRFFNPWRILLLKAFGAKISQKVLIRGSVWIDMPWNLAIGDHSAIGSNVWIYNFAKVKIGSNTVISQGTTLCTASHDYTHPHMTLFSKPIIIQNQVWIAAGCFVNPGIQIEEGAVIGARSVVTKSVSAWTVNAGQPCKKIKDRKLVSI